MIQRYARNPKSVNRQAFQLLLQHVQDQYIQKSLNLYVPNLDDSGLLNRRLNFLLGAKEINKPKCLFAGLDAKSFMEVGAAAFGLKLDQNGKIVGKR